MVSDSPRGDWLALGLVAAMAAGSAWMKRGAGNSSEARKAVETYLRGLLEPRTKELISGVRWKLTYGDPTGQISDWPGLTEACREISEDMNTSFPRRLYFDTVFEDVVEKPEGQRSDEFIEFARSDMKDVVLGRDILDNTSFQRW